jgi:hypothetical protein
MKHSNAKLQRGVSGSALAHPDQGAVDRFAHANRTQRQSCPCPSAVPGAPDGSTPIRLHLPFSETRRWLRLPPKLRRKAIAAILIAHTEGVDLKMLGASWMQLHQLSLHLRALLLTARASGIDAARVSAALDQLETLLGGRRHE